MVSADLSGMGKASGQPVGQVINDGQYVLVAEVEVLQSVPKSIAIL